ncbi:hypothetical protein D3C81_1906650 [compost metagenome]
MLGAQVFQEHAMIAAPDHAQAGRCRVDDGTAEGFTFGNAGVRALRRQDDFALVPAVDCSAASKDCQHQSE